MAPESPGLDPDARSAALAVLLSALSAVTVPPAGLARLRDSLAAPPDAVPSSPEAPEAQLERLTLSELGLDSLGRMELCIQLELDHGVPLTPDRLAAMPLLGHLLAFIAAASASAQP